MLDHYIQVENFGGLESILGKQGRGGPIIPLEEFEGAKILFLDDANLIEGVLARRTESCGLPSDVSFAIIECPEKVAFVTGGFCICISTGLLDSIKLLCEKLSTTPSFRQLFDIQLRNPDKTVAPLSVDEIDIERILNASMRAVYMQSSCYNSAIAFLINHETAHILGGHLSLLSIGQGGDAALAEFNAPTDVPPKNILLRRCLEWDADQASVGKVMSDNLRAVSHLLDWDRILVTYFSTSVVWQLIDQEAPGPRWERMYPPPALRCFSVQAVIDRYLEQWGERLEPPLRERAQLLSQRYRHEMKSFYSLTLRAQIEAGATLDVQDTIDSFGEVGQEALRVLERKWDEILPRLDELRIGPRRFVP